jgi:hypothetical protein
MTRKGLSSFLRPLPFPGALALVVVAAVLSFAQGAAKVRRIAWNDLAPLHAYLQKHNLAEPTFPAFVDRTHADNARRVREGDLDHLVFYILQSREFTRLAPIEPALSAKTLVDAMDDRARQAYLRGEGAPTTAVPRSAAERIDAFVRVADLHGRDERLRYFRDLVASIYPSKPERYEGVRREYLRAMRFVYEKEFVAQRAARPADAVADLYRLRGLSTDTAVEAGYVVFNGLGIAAAGLDPDRRIHRVLIVGPGLDLAPRTALQEDGPPQSYQPWAVLDGLLWLNMVAPGGTVEIVGADINPRVVAHLRRSRENPSQLHLSTELRDGDGVTIHAGFREYFGMLGKRIGNAAGVAERNGHLTKSVRVFTQSSRFVDGQVLDIVTERIEGKPFDLVIATNILPYFDDVQLGLALTNIAAMLGPGGVFLHNERRPLVGDIAEPLGLPFEHSRHVTIADVRGAAPLFDSVFLHRKK